MLTAALARAGDRVHSPTEASAPTTSSTVGELVGTTARKAPTVAVDQAGLQRADLAVVKDDGDEIILISFDGAEVGRGRRGGWYPAERDRGVDVGSDGTLAEAPALDDALPDCGPVHGRGGVRAAVCGTDNAYTEIRVLAADNTSRVLAGPVNPTGRWRYALPSPDGRWVLAQWSGECEVPTAYLFRVAGGAGQPVVGAEFETTAVGWSPDGRAVVGLWPGGCGAASEAPGTYLVNPASGQRRRLHPSHEAVIVTPVRGFYATRMERIMSRAVDELGVPECCAQPSHGGDDAETGFEFEGHEISVYAEPADDTAPAAQPESGELRFVCGSGRYRLRDWGPPGVDSASRPDRAVLRRAAQRLVTRLYCTAGSMEFTP